MLREHTKFPKNMAWDANQTTRDAAKTLSKFIARQPKQARRYWQPQSTFQPLRSHKYIMKFAPMDRLLEGMGYWTAQPHIRHEEEKTVYIVIPQNQTYHCRPPVTKHQAIRTYAEQNPNLGSLGTASSSSSANPNLSVIWEEQ